ncbi:MAG: hypothetical protein QOF11_1564 [Chloroflexota bacterium]|jgi:hypothetical protein|nr:hypothetical protein [Chloroflexota bacterium]
MSECRQYTDGPVAQTALPTTLANPLAEALRLIELAETQGAVLRLMGGLAFHAQAPDWTAGVERERRDIDLATTGRHRKAVTELLAGNGYVPDRQYNALYGHKQLYFVDPARQRPVDVLVDRLEMCHAFVFSDRLALDRPTLPLAELLLSKLQVVKLNRKDVLDILILLAEHPLTPDDSGINTTRVTDLTSADWGWWRTATGNLERLLAFLETEIGPTDLDTGRPNRYRPAAQVEALRAAIDAAPKSTRWRLRARVGDRIAWYEEPEEVGHGR